MQISRSGVRLFVIAMFCLGLVPSFASAGGTYAVKQGGSRPIAWSVTGASQCQGTTPDYPNISDGVYTFWNAYHAGTGNQAGTFNAPGGLYNFTCSAPNATSPTAQDTAQLGVVAPPTNVTAPCNSSDVITVNGTGYPSLSGAQYPLRIWDTTVSPTMPATCTSPGMFCNDNPTYPYNYTGIAGHTYSIWAQTLWNGVWSDSAAPPNVTCPAAATYTLTVNSSGATSVAITGSPSTYSGTTNYSSAGIAGGTSITLTAPTVSGYTFTNWTGCTSTSGATCTVTMNANTTVTANYASSNLGITVSPSTYVVAPSGSVTATYTLTNGNSSNTQCELLDNTGAVLIGYSSCTGSIAFTAPSGISAYAYSIKASQSSTGQTASSAFTVKTTATITATAGTGGTISPSGSVTVTYGANKTFNIAASSGYAISAITVDGAPVTVASTYTFTNVSANHTIDASFAASSGAPVCGTASGSTPQLTEPTTNPAACNPGTYTNSPADTTTSGSQAWNWTCTNGSQTSPTCSAPQYGCNVSTDTNYNATGPNNNWNCSDKCANGDTNYPTCTTSSASSCTGTTVSGCVLSDTTSGGSSGTCDATNGYSGSCNYTCNNGSWTKNSNSCALPAAPACGTANGTPSFTAPSGSTLCSSGSASAVADNFTTWTWTCGTGSSAASCSAPEEHAGACGTSDGGAFAQKPTTNLCAFTKTSPTSVSQSGGHWVWTCTGDQSKNASCSANIIATVSLTSSALRVQPGNGVTLTWNVLNVKSKSCSVTSSDGSLTKTNINGGTSGNGTVNTPGINTNTSFTLSCLDLNNLPTNITVTVGIIPKVQEI